MAKRAWNIVWGGFWLGAFAIGFLLDAPIARWINDHRPLAEHPWLIKILKSPGNFSFTLGVMVLVVAVHRARWRAAVLVGVAALVSSSNEIIKWIVGRTRPFKLDGKLDPFTLQPFRGGMKGLLHGSNLCFPSGHASLAFGTAAAVAILFPRWKWVFLFLACFVAAERVLENAHFLTDNIAAALLGVVSGEVARVVCAQLLRRSAPPGFPIASVPPLSESSSPN